jgi:hypothetical protein
MKKMVLSVLAVIVFSFQPGLAQNSSISTLLNELSADTYGTVLLKMDLTKEMGVLPYEEIDAMEVYTIHEDEGNIDRKMLNELKERLYTLKSDAEYASLMQVKDEGDHVDMYIKQVGDRIKELVMFIIESDDPNDDDDGDLVIIRIKGDFSEDDLGELLKDVNI